MRQSKEERIEAIKSLLPWIGTHRDYMEMAIVIRRYHDARPEPAPPRPAWATYADCHGECCLGEDRCEFQRECRGDSWERVYRWLRTTYRMSDIEDALALLYKVKPSWGKAVIEEYVEPWCDWEHGGKPEPITPEAKLRREIRAELGIAWMEKQPVLAGEITPWDGVRENRNQRILRLWSEGHRSFRKIARIVGCSHHTVAAVVRGQRLRDGRLVTVI